jgi:hypothetical protein
MIGLYQRRCPEARDDAEHYQALNVFALRRLVAMHRTLLAGRFIVAKHALIKALIGVGDYALGRAANALASPDPDPSPSAGWQAAGAAAAGKSGIAGNRKLQQPSPAAANALPGLQKTRVVRRLRGPRMLWRHPILTLRHLLDDRRPVPPLPEKYRPKKRPSA